MRNGNLTRRLSVTEAEALVPPVSALEALRRNLLYAMLRGVSEDEMEEIVKKQVEQAKSGDAKSARLIIDMVRGGGDPAPAVAAQNVVVVRKHTRRPKKA